MEEDTGYLSYLVPAFAIIWALVFGYVFWMSQKQKDVDKKLDSLKAELEEED